MVHRLQSFVGARVSLSQAQSRITYSGWVSLVNPTLLIVRFDEQPDLFRCEEFVAQIRGRDGTAAIACSYIKKTHSSLYSSLKQGSHQSRFTIDLDFFDMEHHFQITSPIEYGAPEPSYAVAVSDVLAQMPFLDSDLRLAVIYIGEYEIGCYSQFRLEPSTRHRISIATDLGAIEFDAIVIESRDIITAEDLYRVVFAVEPIGRVNISRWSDFFALRSSQRIFDINRI